MSKKFRNTIRPAFMRNFTHNTLDRYILIEIDTMTDNEKDIFVSKINERLWHAIQKVNELSEFNLPYINLRRVENFDGNKLRIIIAPDDNDYNPDTPIYINEKESHVVLMKQLSPQRIIQLGNMNGQGRAEILADEQSKILAAVDIFLDIAMFNSISYLRELTLKDKKDFNGIKFEYFIKENLKSFVYINPADPPSYISLAFSQHDSPEKLDYYGYTLCWKKFLNEYFEDYQNENISPVEQLKKHDDYDNIDSIFKSKDYWSKKTSGPYLLLRVNKKPNSKERETRISTYFGNPTFHIGLIKVIPLQEYHMPVLRDDFAELNVSAFKIVVD